MITHNNYFDQTQNVIWSGLPEALSKGNNLVKGASANDWKAYNTNDTIKRVVDAYFLKLEDYLSKTEMPVAEKKTVKAVAKNEVPAKRAPAPASTTKSKHKPAIENTGTPIEKIDADVQYIKRYADLHGKVRTQAQILTFIHSLQKAILERRINKKSTYAKEIRLMQDQLIKCYEKMGEMIEVKIDAKNLKHYLEIAGSQHSMASINLLKAYVSLNGKKDVKDKAEKLIKRIKNAAGSKRVRKDDKYAKVLNEAYINLQKYVKEDLKTLTISKAELNGLSGIMDDDDLFPQKKSLNGTEENTDPASTIVSSKELLDMDFKTIGLQGKYRELIGDPAVGFTAMVYGLPKSGKSTLCLGFAKYLAQHHGKVLFCAIEEGFGYTLKEKIERLGATHPNLFLTDRIPENLSDYDFVFIDSVSKAGLEVADISTLHNQHPETSFIFIYHSTKEGKFKGTNANAHEVDVIIQVENGEATSSGRFSAGGRIGI